MMPFSADSANVGAVRHLPRRSFISLLGASRAISVATMLILYVVLGLLFDQVVAPRYAFGSFRISYRDDTWVEILTVICAGLVLPLDPKRMSEIFAWLSTVFLLVPAAVLSAHQGSDRSAMFMMFGGVWLVMLLCRFLASSDLLFAMSRERAVARVNVGVLLAILLFVLVLLVVHVRGAFSLSMSSIYDFRQEFNESLTFPLNYLLPFAGGPLNGFVVAYLIYKRKYQLLALPFLAGILYFGFSTHKAMLFYPFFAAIIYMSINSRAGHLYLMGLFIALTLITFRVVGTGWEDLLGSSFANRLVFIPAQIHYFFFREFAEIGPQFWAESRLTFGLIPSDLPLSSVNYIGLRMTGDAIIGANTGWIANGYMNGWLFGIVAYAILMAVTLHVIDRLGEKYGYGFVGAAFVIPIFSVINSIDLLAGYLTGGLLLLFVIVFAMIRPEGRHGRPLEAVR
jgi:hypothetical protein